MKSAQSLLNKRYGAARLCLVYRILGSDDIMRLSPKKRGEKPLKTDLCTKLSTLSPKIMRYYGLNISVMKRTGVFGGYPEFEKKPK